MSKSNELFSQIQDNVSYERDMSTHVLLFQ